MTLAWMLGHLERHRRIGWWAGTVVAAASVLEMVAIVGQVVRGRQSHFNVSTPLDDAIFSAMGAVVGMIYLATVVVAVVLIRSSTRDPALALALALRLGVVIAVAGLSVGSLMLRPTPEQAPIPRAESSIVGAHSVGVADGGAGLPLLGWSTTGGDLRVGHFVGMHALQALPLLGIALATTRGRRLDDRTRSRIVVLAAATYGAVFAVTVWQALRGQSIVAPDVATLLAVGTVLALAAAAVAAITGGRRRSRPDGPPVVPPPDRRDHPVRMPS